MPALPSVKAKNQHPAGAEGQQFPLHPCHVQATRATPGASHLVRITHPMAFKVLNPNIRKQTLGISRTQGAGSVLLLHKATTRAREQTFPWAPRAPSYSDHPNPAADTSVLGSTRLCSQFMSWA